VADVCVHGGCTACSAIFRRIAGLNFI
jgi:hypothetical protein